MYTLFFVCIDEKCGSPYGCYAMRTFILVLDTSYFPVAVLTKFVGKCQQFCYFKPGSQLFDRNFSVINVTFLLAMSSQVWDNVGVDFW